jgi:2,5-diketo-D-gluconate reductase B
MTNELSADGVPRASGMPRLGLGTWQNTDPDQCAESVRTALEMGYRHVDTARAYGNEGAVGRGVAAASVPREEVFLATKVWKDDLAHDDAIATAERSLEELGVAYLDLLYVHWPAGSYDPEETMTALAHLRDRGLIEHIGVSNFEPAHLDAARAATDAPIFANQVEMHPFLPQTELRSYTAAADIELVAYSPLDRGAVFEDPTLGEIAKAHGVSEAQVSLAWLREKGVTAIPKATAESHVRDNWKSLALELTEEDVAAIDAIDHRQRRVNPGFGPDAWN